MNYTDFAGYRVNLHTYPCGHAQEQSGGSVNQIRRAKDMHDRGEIKGRTVLDKNDFNAIPPGIKIPFLKKSPPATSQRNMGSDATLGGRCRMILI